MRTIRILALASAVLAAAGVAHAQVELDRIVSRVNNSIITRADIAQARALGLIADVSSDEAVQRALEDRLLVLSEIARANAIVVSDADVEARRRAWETRVGGPQRAADLLGQAGMSDAELRMWMSNDARIQAYLKGQFSGVPDGERAKSTADWMSRLRLRAGIR
jgi:hypothetical protein